MPLTDQQERDLMREALAEAERGLNEGEAPIGCLIATCESEQFRILSRGHNRVRALRRKTAHAEMVAFENAVLPEDEPLILLSTLEPCVMCLSACFESAIAEVRYGLAAPADGGTRRVQPPASPDTRVPNVKGGLLAAESRQLIDLFVARYRGKTDTAYAEQLLALTR